MALQYECIGCACIDACDQVMDKMNYPRGLIRYSTENAMKRNWGSREILAHVFRPRTLIYGTILAAICAAFVWGLAAREPLRVDVLRDRLARTGDRGWPDRERLPASGHEHDRVAACVQHRRLRPERNPHQGP